MSSVDVSGRDRENRPGLEGLFLLIYVGEPFARRRPFTLGHFEEEFLHLLRDWATSAIADRNPINGTNRRDFRRCAGEEKLVGNVEGGALNRALLNSNAQFLADLDDAVASNAGQNRRRKRRSQNDVASDEEIFSPEPSET